MRPRELRIHAVLKNPCVCCDACMSVVLGAAIP